MYYVGSFMQVLSTQPKILVYSVDTGHTYITYIYIFLYHLSQKKILHTFML